MFDFDKLTYEQLKIERAHRQADQVLMKAMANLLIEDCREPFMVLSQLQIDNIDNCVDRLKRAGCDRIDFSDVALRYAERFAHYWPELDERVRKHSAYFAQVQS